MYHKRPPRIMNRTVPKIIAISVHTVNRFPLSGEATNFIVFGLTQQPELTFDCTQGEHANHYTPLMWSIQQRQYTTLTHTD